MFLFFAFNPSLMLRNITLPVLCLLLLPVLLFGQRDRETRAVDSFHSLEIRGGFEVELTQGPTHSLTIEAPAELLRRITSEVRGGVLILDVEGKIRGDHKLVLHVTSPQFRRVQIGGAADLTATTPLAGRSFELFISGAADVELALAMDEVQVDISGAGEVELTGAADRVHFQVAGAGEVEAADLRAAEVTVNISGTGEAEVHATELLDVSIAGIGSVQYRGNPEIRRSIAGLGTLEAL